MDSVYVIYFDDKLYKSNSCKTVYLKESSAKQVITSEAKSLARITFNKENNDKCWYDLSRKEEIPYIEQMKNRFSIHRFIDENTVNLYKDELVNLLPRKNINIKSKFIK